MDNQNNSNKSYDQLIKEQKNRKKGIALIVIGIVALALGFCGLYLLILVGIGLIVWGGYIMYKNGSDREMIDFQEKIIPEILKSKFDVILHSKEGNLSAVELAEAGFCPAGDETEDNDYIEGNYKGVHFEFGDVRCSHEEEHYDSENGTSTTTVYSFKGSVIKLKTTDTFKGYIQIKEKLIKKNSVKTGNDVFDKRYAVYSDFDETYVNSVLSPAVIDALIRLDNYGGTKNKLYVSFENNIAYFGLHNNKDLFEKTLKNLDETKALYQADTNYIAGMLDIILSSGMSFEQS